MSKKIKTLIVTDYMGSLGTQPEEEAEYIARLFLEMYGIELDWQHSTSVDTREYTPDLIIIDYGGILPGSDMDVWELRQLAEWAAEHPSKLALIWTSFTAKVWVFELEDEFKDLDNILLWVPVGPNGRRTLPDFDTEHIHQESVAQKIRFWYGK